MQASKSAYDVPPFPAFPSTSRYVPLGSVQEAMTRVCRSVEARETISLIVGPPGTGKSLICRLLHERYRQTHDVVVLGETPIESRKALLQHLLHQLHVESHGDDLQLTLIDYLCGDQSSENGLLILVDEAQSLSVEVIESIRMVTNIIREDEPRVIAVLCGGVKLDEILVDASMEAFTQRVATRCYLHPMNAQETRQYVAETIRKCGAEPNETITDEAIAAVHHACSGVPRLINQMLTQAIDCAADCDEAVITEPIVDQAWAQLQQLPSPMVEEPKFATDSAPIEFGELDESMDNTDLNQTDSELLTENCSGCGVGCGSCGDAVEIQTVVQDKLDSPIDKELDVDAEVEALTFESEVSYEDEPTFEPASRTSEDLFGTFEDEEVLAIGESFQNLSGSVVSKEWEELPIENGLDEVIHVEKIATENSHLEIEEVDLPPIEANSCAHDADAQADCSVEQPIEQVVQEGSADEAVAVNEIVQPNGAPDLEEILRQEIVGLSQMAHASLQDSGVGTVEFECDSSYPEHPSVEIVVESDVELSTIDSAEITDEVEADSIRVMSSKQDSAEPLDDFLVVSSQADAGDVESQDKDENPVLWMDDTECDDPASDIKLIRDDSDILVIEDEIELRRIDPAARRDSQDQTISVDFQAMLERMRSGT